MGLQFISDSNGKTSGVFIPIDEWNKLKERFKGIDQQENIPEWQVKEVNERLEEYKKSPNSGIDFNSAIDDIEREL